MLPLQHKKSFEQIIKILSPDMRKKNLLTFYFRATIEARRLSRRSLRLIENQERDMKWMKWKRDKSIKVGKKYIWNSYIIIDNGIGNKVWLGKQLSECTSIAIGWLPDLETARYIAYLLSKK